MSEEIKELVKNIEENNVAYRIGKAVVSDEVYDGWVDRLEELDPENPVLSKVGYIDDDDERKQKLPITMASMNKVKTIELLHKWFKFKNIPLNTPLILTSKYDGCSFCSNENKSEGYTRGDGEYGQRSDDHLNLILNNENRERKIQSLLGESNGIIEYPNMLTYGEIIMPRQAFLDFYSNDFKNPRNLVGGLVNADDAREPLNDCRYIRYGLVSDDMIEKFQTKDKLLDFLNDNQTTKVPYKVVTIEDLSTENLRDLFFEWSKDFELDGIIVEINDLAYAESLGRERNGNPAYARAYKGEFEQRKTSKVLELIYSISKKGYAIPRIRIEPIELDGVTVTYVTGNNARYIMDMGIGVGSEVLVKRSGMVIPYIIKVTETVDFTIPDIGYELVWDENKVHLITTEVTDEQRLQQIISFFKILGVENVSEGVCTQFFEAGFDTVKSILSMSKSDMERIERFGSRKAEIVHTGIHSKMKDVTLSKLQHATGLFEMLGSKKLLLLEDLENPTTADICNVEGFSDKSAKAYFEGIEKFNEFLEDLVGLVSVKKTEKTEVLSNDLLDKVFVFTGVRRADLNEIIESKGGKIASGVSAKITHLVMKEKGSGSSKEIKALNLGKEILTVEELELMLGV